MVPITLTVRIGTMMSPSAGILQRLITVFTIRWFIAIIIPLPGITPTPSMPAIWTIVPAHGAGRVEGEAASMSSSSPVRSLRTRAPVTAPLPRCRSITRW